MIFHMHLAVSIVAGLGIAASGVSGATGSEIKLLTAGVFKQAVLALVPDFEKRNGPKVIVDYDAAGALKKRTKGGEVFDVGVITPAVANKLKSKSMNPAT